MLQYLGSIVDRFAVHAAQCSVNEDYFEILIQHGDVAYQRCIEPINYVSIVGIVLLTALVEWLLWLMAFLYCFVKVFQKANSWGIRAAAVTMITIFVLLRLAFLPVVIVSLPLTERMSRSITTPLIEDLQWFAFSCFAIVLAVPWLLCIYQLITHSLGKPKEADYFVDDHSAPKVAIIMPCYKEPANILIRTVDSIVESHYPKSCLHLFLSFDGDDEDYLYLETIERLGVPMVRSYGYPVSIDVVYKDVRITISRFVHGGKRHCQKQTFKLMSKIYQQYIRVNDDIFILFIDSDCILDRYCIHKLMYEMELKPGSKHNMLAMTGIVTCTTERTSLITLMQDLEYVHGQLFERSVESGCGAITCLPGALTVLRVSAFRSLAKEYFADKAEQCEDLFDYGKCHLGEDRWLTHLFMIAAEKQYQIAVTTGAFCKTEAVKTFKSLLKQRRRWFLGFVTNEACMLTDVRVWRRYPFLCIIRLAQDTIRTTGLFFFVVLIALMTDSQVANNLPMGFVVIAIGLNWLLMIYFATALGRWKMLLYPVLFILGPFFDWTYIVYGVLTAGRRTWGGPRADAGQADALTSPQAAIEYAEETGDDLNVVPETFRSAVENQASAPRAKPSRISLQPADHHEGRFRSTHTEQRHPLSDGSDAEDAVSDTGSSRPFAHITTARARSAEPPRRSIDTTNSLFTDARQSVHLPRRAESLNTLTTNENDSRSTATRSLTSNVSRSRAHPPSAGSALATIRLSQPHLEVPSRIKHRNSFSRHAGVTKGAAERDGFQKVAGSERGAANAGVSTTTQLDGADDAASVLTVNEGGVPLVRVVDKTKDGEGA